MANNKASDDPMPLDMERGLKTNECAKLLGIAPITAAQWRSRGEGPPFYRCNRAIRYRLADVLAYRDARKVGQ